MNLKFIYLFYLFILLINYGFFLRIERISKRGIEINIIELHEKFKQLKYLESNDVSIVDKLRLIEKSSFINLTNQYNPNLFKNLDIDF